MIEAQVRPTFAMTDPSNNDDDFQYVFGRQEWQQEQPPKERSTGRKRPSGGNHAEVSTKGRDASAEDPEKGGQTMVFPVKLHRLLESEDEESAAVVSWQPHGRAFLVHNKEAFVQSFLPTYFRQSKWASFQRQLNIYGFQRLTAGRDRGAYYHDLFLRGHPELAPRIHRMKLKGIGQGRHRTNAELEPNFYRMNPVGAGDRIDATTNGMQPNASDPAAALASVPSPPILTNAQSSGTSTINVLQLFGGGGSGASNQSQSMASNIVLAGSNTDLNNLFFLANGNEYTSLQNLGSVPIPAGGRDTGESQQDGLQCGQHLSLLANLFSAAKSNNSGNLNSGSVESPTHLSHPNRRNNIGGDDDRSDDFSQWLTSNNSAFPPLLQNTDTSLLSTATLMQYMKSDNNFTDERFGGRRLSDAAISGAAGANAPRSQSQSPWASLAASGFGGSSHQQASFAMHQGDHSLPVNSGGLGDSNSCSDLVNTFGFDGPSLRRMSAAAMSTLLSSANNSGGGNNNLGNAFDSNTNLLLFSSLQRSRNSSSNLMDIGPADSPSFSTAQALNRLGGAHSSTNSTNPASQQLALLNAANSGQSSGSNGQGGFNFADLLSTTRAASSQPTFLDSVYEPIPIKEDANSMNIETTVAAASGNGQQHKLSAIAATRRGSGRGGFLQFHSDRR